MPQVSRGTNWRHRPESSYCSFRVPKSPPIRVISKWEDYTPAEVRETVDHVIIEHATQFLGPVQQSQITDEIRRVFVNSAHATWSTKRRDCDAWPCSSDLDPLYPEDVRLEVGTWRLDNLPPYPTRRRVREARRAGSPAFCYVSHDKDNELIYIRWCDANGRRASSDNIRWQNDFEDKDEAEYFAVSHHDDCLLERVEAYNRAISICRIQRHAKVIAARSEKNPDNFLRGDEDNDPYMPAYEPFTPISDEYWEEVRTEAEERHWW